MATVRVTISKVNTGDTLFKDYGASPVIGIVDSDIIYLPSGAGSLMVNTATGATVEIDATIAEIVTAFGVDIVNLV